MSFKSISREVGFAGFAASPLLANQIWAAVLLTIFGIIFRASTLKELRAWQIAYMRERRLDRKQEISMRASAGVDSGSSAA